MMGGLHTAQLSRRKIRPAHAGFTIVETLIVLAITGVMFVTVAVNVSGRQHKVEFSQSVNQLKGQVEQIMGEVESGYFPSTKFDCTVSGPHNNVTYTFAYGSPSDPTQGTRKSCAFMGKAIQFGTAFGTDPQKYAVYSLVGLNGLIDKDAVDFQSSAPAPVPLSGLTVKRSLQNGLTVKRMWWGSSTSIGAVAFTTYYASDGSNSYGSQSVQIVPVKNSRLDEDGIARMTDKLAQSYADRNPTEGVKLCVDGGRGQSAIMTIGAAGSTSSVTLDIKNKPDCQN